MYIKNREKVCLIDTFEVKWLTITRTRCKQASKVYKILARNGLAASDVALEAS